MKSDVDKSITIFHVGGVGEYGPIEAILSSQFAKYITLVLFEARGENEEDLIVHEEHSLRGIKTFIVPYCISDKAGRVNFYVNEESVSSSIFKPNVEASKMHLESYPDHIRTWGDNTQLDQEISLEAITLDDAIVKYNFPNPDIISIDAQGAELKILKSCLSSLQSSTTCVVTEIEFAEIYQGQSLFCDQVSLLHNYDFSLMDIVNTQYWHPEMTFGKGFLTVGEAIFLKKHNRLSSFLNNEGFPKLIKLACISLCFHRYSMTYYIISILIDSDLKNKTLSFISENKDFKVLEDIFLFINKNRNEYYEKNKYIFSEYSVTSDFKIHKNKNIYVYVKRRDRVKRKFNTIIDKLFNIFTILRLR